MAGDKFLPVIDISQNHGIVGALMDLLSEACNFQPSTHSATRPITNPPVRHAATAPSTHSPVSVFGRQADIALHKESLLTLLYMLLGQKQASQETRVFTICRISLLEYQQPLNRNCWYTSSSEY